MNENVLSVVDTVASILQNDRFNLISNILKLGRESKSISDGIMYTKLATFLKYAGPLSDNVENTFYDKVLFGDEKKSQQFFLELLLRLGKLDEVAKIRYFAMLCDARVTSNIEVALFDKIYYTILSCTVSELDFIRNHMGKSIAEKDNTITMFSMIQMGLIQKSYNETTKSNLFYFTEYARMVYKYALNYNRIIDEKNVTLNEITIEEDSYALKKVLKLEEKKEQIPIEKIEPYLDFSNNTFRLEFVINKTGIKIEPERLYFAFRSNGDYYSCQNLYVNNYLGALKQNVFTIQREFAKDGLKSWAEYGFIFYFKVRAEEVRYIKIFCYGNGYASQEVDKTVYENEVRQWDGFFEKINESAHNNFIIRLATLIMNFDYSR